MVVRLRVQVVSSRVTITSRLRARVRVVGHGYGLFHGTSYLRGGFLLRRRAYYDRATRVLRGENLVRVSNALYQRVRGRIPNGSTRSRRTTYVLGNIVQVSRLSTGYAYFLALTRTRRL